MCQILFPNQIFRELVRELNGEYGLSLVSGDGGQGHFNFELNSLTTYWQLSSYGTPWGKEEVEA